VLFGSYARGNQTETSDVDFLVVLNDEEVKFARESRTFSSIITKVAIENDVWISPKPTSLNKYLHSLFPLFKISKRRE
jgi:predicted nucleotidyltransferase